MHARNCRDGGTENGSDQYINVDIFDPGGNKGRGSNVRIQLREIAQRGSLIVDVRDPPDETGLSRQDHQNVQTPTLLARQCSGTPRTQWTSPHRQRACRVPEERLQCLPWKARRGCPGAAKFFPPDQWVGAAIEPKGDAWSPRG